MKFLSFMPPSKDANAPFTHALFELSEVMGQYRQLLGQNRTHKQQFAKTYWLQRAKISSRYEKYHGYRTRLLMRCARREDEEVHRQPRSFEL
jgi:hypothetical protein